VLLLLLLLLLDSAKVGGAGASGILMAQSDVL